MKPVVWLAVYCLSICACSSAMAQQTPRLLVMGGGDESELTIGQLKPAYIDFGWREAPRLAVSEIVKRYVYLLREAEDPEIRLKALERLGALENLHGEVVEQVLDREAIGEVAIETYEDHLAAYPGQEKNDWAMYQLARAYDLAGRRDEALRTLEQLTAQFPNSQMAAESYFRIGEFHYQNQAFVEAERAFKDALTHRGGGPFRFNSEYMLGWSQFRMDEWDNSMDTFISVLEKLQKQAEENIRVELRDDVLRIMSIIATRQDGTDSLFAALDRNRAEKLAPLVYEFHYRYYLEQTQYQDAAAVAAHYIENYPGSAGRIDFHEYRVEAYQQGNLPTLVREEKQNVVAALGPGSKYYRVQSRDKTTRAKLDGLLARYLDELARYEYALGGKVAEAERSAHWQRAEGYLKQLIQLAPNDTRFAQSYLLLGEVRLKDGRWEEALPAFQRAAYDFPDYPDRAEAGYAVVTAFPEDALLTDEQRRQKAKELDRFAATFVEHPEHAQVALAASQAWLGLGEVAKAEDLAVALLESTSDEGSQASALSPALGADLAAEIWLVRGHAAFAQDNYMDAEIGYRQALSLLASEDARRSDLENNLAASLYRQGENLQNEGDLAGAQAMYLAAAREFPESAVAEVALYDAAMRSIDLTQWTASSELLSEYRERFPEQSERREVRQKQVYVYEQAGNFAAAAAALTSMKVGLNDEAARQAQFQIVELYRKAGESEAGSVEAEAYMASYPRPFETWIAVHQYRLEWALESGDSAQIAKWRKNLVASEAKGGADRTAATRSVAAEAAWGLLQQDQLRYESIDLTLPLNQSLAQKSEALKALVAGLQGVNAYGVADYSTRSTHAMGEAYQQLSQALMDSERPGNLTDLALEQYELLLEEQAFPFEEQAIGFFEQNVGRLPDGYHDDWIDSSLQALAVLLPVRYAKSENTSEWVGGIR